MVLTCILTFGDAQSLQDAVNEEGSIEALPVGVGLSDELLGIGRPPFRLEDLLKLAEVGHLEPYLRRRWLLRRNAVVANGDFGRLPERRQQQLQVAPGVQSSTTGLEITYRRAG